MLTLFKGLVREEEGQDMVEYALILAFVAIAAAAVITTVGSDVNTIWTATKNQTGAAASAAS